MTLATEQPPAPKTTLPKDRPSDQGKAGGLVLEGRGAVEGSWERWVHSGDGAPVALPDWEALPKNSRRILTLPTVQLLAWPLWIAAEGEASDLVSLELSGRHLLRKGMEESMRVLPLTESSGRRLVLAVAGEEPFSEADLPSDWKTADRYAVRPFLFGDETTDLILWKEHGVTFACFRREAMPVWFGPLGDDLSPGLLLRTSLRLLSEGILTHTIRSILLVGGFSDDSRGALSRFFPSATLTTQPMAVWPGERVAEKEDFPPAAAMADRRRRKQWERIKQIAAGVALLYLLFLLWAIGDHVIQNRALINWKGKLAALNQPAHQAQADSERWKALRTAVDPSTYPLDLLAAVAAPTEGGKVRLTAFTLEKGRLQISGEATDVTQAYAFIDQLKKSVALREYDWTAGQPQLAGKNSVKFDMEGVRPDAAK